MNELSKEKMMTVREVAEALNVPIRTVHENLDKIGVEKKNGIKTYLNEVQVTELSKSLKKAHNADLASTRKVASTELELFDRARDLIYDLTQKVAELYEQNEAMLPKAETYDRFMQAENAQPMADVAKMLGYGRNKFFNRLRAAGILKSDNTPYQQYMHYFELIDKPIQMGGKTVNKPVTLVKPEGIEYLSKRYRGEK